MISLSPSLSPQLFSPYIMRPNCESSEAIIQLGQQIFPSGPYGAVNMTSVAAQLSEKHVHMWLLFLRCSVFTNGQPAFVALTETVKMRSFVSDAQMQAEKSHAVFRPARPKNGCSLLSLKTLSYKILHGRDRGRGTDIFLAALY